jgi:hypothetical protein
MLSLRMAYSFQRMVLYMAVGQNICAASQNPVPFRRYMSFRRLNDRIHILCERAVKAPEGPELEKVIRELRAALSEQIMRLRRKAVERLTERRSE